MASNLAQLAINNDKFRKILYTDQNSQLALMSVIKGIPREIHHATQFINLVRGQAKVILNDTKELLISSGNTIIIPEGQYHEIINLGKTPLKIYTIYSPKVH